MKLQHLEKDIVVKSRQPRPAKSKSKLKRMLIENGGVAQLGEHLLCKQGVRSSILLISTIQKEKRKL